MQVIFILSLYVTYEKNQCNHNNQKINGIKKANRSFDQVDLRIKKAS